MTTTEPAAGAEVPPRPKRTERWVWLLYAIAAVLAVALWLVNHKADRSDQHATDAQRSADSVRSALAVANGRIVHLGGTPVPTPSAAQDGSAPPGRTGAKGPAGSTGPGPSQAQISQAVAEYCAQHSGCRGTPSRTQVEGAVRAYCSAGACRGRPGASGAPGAAGTSGEPGAQGATGPGPDDTQVQAAVAAYCAAHGDCTGPAGPQGAAGSQGPQGDTGRGIASIDCTGLGVDQLVVHYDDGTTQTIPCTTPTPTASQTS